jgi:hypothetical protein
MWYYYQLSNFLFYIVQIPTYSHFCKIQQHISEVSNEPARKYIDKTLQTNKIDATVTTIMRAGAKDKAALY